MRPSWDQYWIGLAFFISARSRDAETKHGCIIVDGSNRIVGTGYNSFIKNIDDEALPNTRPEKYPFMIHSEENAILNSKVPPSQCRGEVTAYVTGKCCNTCLQRLIQAEVSRIVMAKRKGTQLESEKTENDFRKIVALSRVKIEVIEPRPEWMLEIFKTLYENSPNPPF